MDYRHHPIRKEDDDAHRTEFCHIAGIGEKDSWNENKKIFLGACKINVFMKGDFSVTVGDRVFRPLYGDICFLPPLTLHYGKIPKDTALDYFQFDIGLSAFDGVPDGGALLERLCERVKDQNPFVRPKNTDIERAISLCRETEQAISEKNRAAAFAGAIRFVDLLNQIYSDPVRPEPVVLSRNTALVLRMIDEHYGERITVGSLAALCGVSESYLSRSFKKEVGDTIHHYLLARRMRAAVEMLPDHSVAEVSVACGFYDSSHLLRRLR